MLDQIANEIIIASTLLKSNNVQFIAESLGYKPMLIITALFRGVEVGKFEYDQKKGIIKISPDVDVNSLSVTEGMNELTGLIEDFVTYRNAEEKDDTIGDLWAFLGGTPELHVQIAVHASPKLATYELIDPKDKESVYTFVTLKDNADKLWGQKAFKAKPKGKAAKRAQAAIKRATDKK